MDGTDLAEIRFLADDRFKKVTKTLDLLGPGKNSTIYITSMVVVRDLTDQHRVTDQIGYPIQWPTLLRTQEHWLTGSKTKTVVITAFVKRRY